MSEDELNRKIETKVDVMMKRLEDRLCKDGKVSVAPSVSIHGWKAAGVIVAVLAAIATPILSVTWFLSDRVTQVEDVKQDVDRIRNEVSGLRQDVSAESASTRKEIQRLREAFAAYTHVMLPMTANGHSDPPDLLPRTPSTPMLTPLPGATLLGVP